MSLKLITNATKRYSITEFRNKHDCAKKVSLFTENKNLFFYNLKVFYVTLKFYFIFWRTAKLTIINKDFSFLYDSPVISLFFAV